MSTRPKVFNRGKAEARNVQLFDLDEENSFISKMDIQRKFPVPILEQHQSVELVAMVILSSGPRIHIKLRWDDKTGTGHEKELTPTL